MARMVFEKPVVLWEQGMCPIFVENPAEVLGLLLLLVSEETSCARVTVVFLKARANFLLISCNCDCIFS